MDQKKNNKLTDIEQILERLQSIENRATRIESKILQWDPEAFTVESGQISSAVSDHVDQKSKGFSESNVGQYGLSWLANIVYIIGIGFIITYIKNLGQPELSALIGFVGVLGMFVFGYLLRWRQFKYISFIVQSSALLLLFYVTAYLYFLSSPPILNNKWLVMVLLFGVIIGQFYFALKKHSQPLAFIGVLMVLITAVFSDASFPMLGLNLVAAAIATYFFYKNTWWQVFFISLFLVYLNHICWLFSNPLLGNPIETVGSHQYNLVYLFGYGIVFSLPAILKGWKNSYHGVLISTLILNALLFFITLLLAIISFYEDSYVWIFALVSAICLIYSIVLQKISELQYSSAFYACFGFISMSIAIFSYFELPDSYLLFALQNLLVLGMALWFRSTIITVVNTILFFFLLIFYLSTVESVDSINFAFALTALFSSRLLDWKQDRLPIKTGSIRNIYLVFAFVMVLYAFYHAMPPQYVTLSWTAVAGIYFISNLILKNVKYRWMAIGTFILTAGYLLLVDLQHMSMIFKISSLLFLAVISLGVSLYYSRRRSKQ